MDLIKREPLFEENELVQFISNTFKDEMVPKDKETFLKCFNHETTDGSLCFSYKFGKDEDDWAMMFFYPTHCAVPIPYQKHLRNDGYCNLCLLVLNYQFMLAEKLEDINYLLNLQYEAMVRYGNTNFLRVNAERFLDDEDGKDRETIRRERKESLAEYETRFKQFDDFITEKIETLQDNLGV